MQVKIVLFGRLTDITKRNTFIVEDVQDTDQLVNRLQELYPGFIQAPYIIAVEKHIIHQNTQLDDNATVALLPPYSGG